MAFTVTCVGDSLTNSTGISGNEPPEWPDRVNLQSVTMLNYAVGGTRIHQAAARIVSHALPQNPAVVVVITGTNNNVFSDGIAVMKRDYVALISLLVGRNALYGNIIPRANYTDAMEDIRLEWNEWLLTLGIPVMDLASLVTVPSYSTRLIYPEFTFDGTHLAPLGKDKFASEVQGRLAVICGANPHQGF